MDGNGLSQNIYNSPSFRESLNIELCNLSYNIDQRIDQKLNRQY